MDREAIISKVKKCLALSKSANNNEAAVAFKMAQQLMEEHQITQVDVDISDVVETQVLMCRAQNPPTYIVSLANCVASAFGCKIIADCDWIQTRVSFLGMGAQSEVGAYAFDVLRRALTRGRKEFISTIPKRTKAANKTRRADAWCNGWVIAVTKKVRKLAVPEATEAMIAKWMEEKHPDLETTEGRERKMTDKDLIDAVRGYGEGEKQQLHPGVAGESHALLEATV